MTYLDTSALIKGFVAEEGTPLVRSILSGSEAVATAKIAYAEVYAGLTRRQREGDLSAAEYALACHQFEAEWQGYIRLELLDDLLLVARRVIQRHPLRGFDAIHLASALTLKNGTNQDITFAAADRRLLRAAQLERLRALNVEVTPTT